MWKQGGGSADHDFYIALITNNDSFKIWISEIETKKVGISFKKKRIFCFLCGFWNVQSHGVPSFPLYTTSKIFACGGLFF